MKVIEDPNCIIGYVLEVQIYLNDTDNSRWNGRFLHVGYMAKVFKTKEEACEYYDKHNPHMRKLNIQHTLRSDWDPKTYLRYIVRVYNAENCLIKPFSEK